MEQRKNLLVHKCKDLSSDPQNSHKSQQVRQLLAILPLRRQRPGSVASWPAGLARTGMLQVQKEDIAK